MATVFIPNTFIAGQPAVATEVNQNFIAITDQVNGNLDANNLADSAVTASKLAPDSVTTSKIGDFQVSDDKVATGVSATKIADGSVSNTEFQYLSGVTSDIQTQINSKGETITLTVDRAVISNGSGALAASPVTSTELGYLDGVTSSVQTQLNSAASKLPQSIRVAYAASIPTKVAGHADLGIAAWPGDGQFRITHSQGDTNFAVQVQRINSVLSGSDPSLVAGNISIPHVTVTSTTIDVWFLETDLSGFQVVDVDFFLTITPY